MKCMSPFVSCVIGFLALPLIAWSAEPDIAAALSARIVDEGATVVQMQKYTQARIPALPEVKSVEEWEQHADRIRQDVLAQVVFRGEAAKWRDANVAVEWLDTIPGGPGYQIRKLRYEALPGMWIPALLYQPTELKEKVPVVLNVNGHDGNGKAAPYKQLRCINLAKRGMLALNVEWLGMGQLMTNGFNHYRLNQIDLCGTSGLAPFYLSMQRAIDLLISLEHADPARVAVAGLSGGGWQTIIISSLDERVALANPVAGYSSFVQRAEVPPDLGDSEQSPTDLATVADYLHLTALRAPRPTLLTYNDKDQCCFKADQALPPLMEGAGPFFALYGRADALRSHVNSDPGTHNFEVDNRQQFYRMIGDFFYPGVAGFDWKEIPSEPEVKTPEELMVPLPEPNVDLHSLAVVLSQELPKDAALPEDAATAATWQTEQRLALRQTLKLKDHTVRGTPGELQMGETRAVTPWRIEIDNDWTLPLTEVSALEPTATVLVLHDEGRAKAAATVEKLVGEKKRVLAVDVYNIGEARTGKWEDRYALFLTAIGDRPLGMQAGQVTAIARWAKQQFQSVPVQIVAEGPKSSLIALAAAAVETDAIAGVELKGCYATLKEVIEQDLTALQAPELFCFGLLEQFDVLQISALVSPRPVVFVEPTERLKQATAPLGAWAERVRGK